MYAIPPPPSGNLNKNIISSYEFANDTGASEKAGKEELYGHCHNGHWGKVVLNDQEKSFSLGSGCRYTVDHLVLDGKRVDEFYLGQWNGHRHENATVLYINEFSYLEDNFIYISMVGHSHYYIKSKYDWDVIDKIKHISMAGHKSSFTRVNDDYVRLVRTNEAWSGVPEPMTYGAILGAVGLSAVVLRQKRKRKFAHP